MSFINFINKFVSPTVEEDVVNGVVEIKHINVHFLIRDLNHVWNSSVFANWMFNNVSPYRITLYSYFVPDLYYALTDVLNYKKMLYSKRKDIQILLDLLKTKTWYKDYFAIHPPRLNYNKLSELKYTLLPVQLEAVKAYDYKTTALHLNGYLLDAATGAGKGLMALAIASCSESDVNIVLCPKSIIDSVWADYINVQFGGNKKIWKSNSNIEITKGYDYYIFNFEAIDKAVDFFKTNKYNKPFIVLDESHNFNNKSALRTSSFLELCKITKSKDIVFSSGTPLGVAANESIPLFQAIDPLFTPQVEIRFKGIYKKSSKRGLEILNNRLGMISHKIEKHEIMKDDKPIFSEIKVKLKDPIRYTLSYIKNEFSEFMDKRCKELLKEMDTHEKIYFEVINNYKNNLKTPEEKNGFKTYTDYVNEMRRAGFDPYTHGPLSRYCNVLEKEKIIPTIKDSELRNKFKKSKGVYKYYKLVALGNFLGGILAKRRAELHSALIEHSGIVDIVNNSIKKTICFTDYVETVLTAKEYFEKNGLKPALVFADTNKDINSIINDFRDSPIKNPLIATTKSMSTGVTVICANTIIFLNKPFRSRDVDQCVARSYRLGQTEQVYVYTIVLDTGSESNLSDRMSEILAWSEDQSLAMTGTNSKRIQGGQLIEPETILEDTTLEELIDDENIIKDILNLKINNESIGSSLSIVDSKINWELKPYIKKSSLDW